MSTQNRMGTPDWPRFLKYVVKLENGCWFWIGAIRGNGRNEYGAFWAAGGTRRAHIVSYVWTYGEPNADLHHTCENSLCVNPEHLVPASAGQPRHRNVIPGLFACGHEIIPENTYRDPKTGYRTCSICKAARAAKTYAEMADEERDALNAKRRARRKHITYEPRQCQEPECTNIYQPVRSDSRYCTEQDCINRRQIANRNHRLGRKLQ